MAKEVIKIPLNEVASKSKTTAKDDGKIIPAIKTKTLSEAYKEMWEGKSKK